MTHTEFIARRVSAAIARGEPFVIEASASVGRYVQGGLTGANTLYLEAADLDLQETGQLDEHAVAELTRLGFERGPNNFTQTCDVTSADSASKLAGQLLAEVFRIYGVSESQPLRAGEEYSSDWLETRDVLGSPYPSAVQTYDQRRRWNWSILVAAATSSQFEDDGGIDNAFVRQASRSIYNDPAFVDDGTEADFEHAVAEARSAGLIPTLDAFR